MITDKSTDGEIRKFFDKKDMVYITIPKTGSSTIRERFLRRLPGNATFIHDGFLFGLRAKHALREFSQREMTNEFLAELIAEERVFTVIRDPLERFVSSFVYVNSSSRFKEERRKFDYDFANPHELMAFCSQESLTEFKPEIEIGGRSRIGHHTQSQLSLLRENTRNFKLTFSDLPAVFSINSINRLHLLILNRNAKRVNDNTKHYARWKDKVLSKYGDLEEGVKAHFEQDYEAMQGFV
jgi:hypothetical protein